MRYLVTGGAGFIGSHLVETLIGRGEDVAVLDDFSTGRWENLAPFEGSFELIEGTITDPADCARAVRGATFILHQAALGSVPRSVEDPATTHDVNATGTLNVLRAAVEAGARRVAYAASSSAYGDTEELPKHEGMVPRPRSPYAVAKLSGEEYCRAFHASYGLGTVALRYFNVFGPRQDPESRYAAVIPRFATAALAGRPATIFGDGEQSRDFTFVANVVEANLLATTAPDAALGEVFNVGAGHRTTINELWRSISALAGGGGTPEYREARPGDVRHSLASLERAGRLLGYAPAVDVQDGLRRTVAWYRATADVGA
ncbi:MAG TPA: SDR family oxidoreductase [Longimicrobiales bacterium]|nr:SDR family oxidoreductase [Longimicrobiales bacterium]